MSSLLPVPDMGEGVEWPFEIPIRLTIEVQVGRAPQLERCSGPSSVVGPLCFSCCDVLSKKLRDGMRRDRMRTFVGMLIEERHP